jgi:hypothetical protein
MTFAGVHVSSGALFLSICDADPTADSGVALRVDASNKIELAVGMSESAQLNDVLSRLRQDLRTHGVADVGILHTRKHGQWAYSTAFKRISLVTCVLLAAEMVGIRSATVRTEDVSRALRVPVQELDAIPADRFGLDAPPKYWRAGLAAASGAAATLAR